MTEFGYNANYLTRDGQPWFPVMGEIHYSRVPKEDWKESLYKMKAGGLDIASSYVIWIHHEEIEGEYDFNYNKDLRSFVEACLECGLYFFLRIGPWIHGEVRNGGFPDWLLNKGYKLRYDDPGYLKEVKKYYSRIYDEVKGLFHKDGGPIIGVQIENELGHCGGAYGEDGEQHMKTLHKIARDIGFDVPYYTATGWGGAATGGLLPVMGGYPDAPWDPRLTELEPSGNYVFTYERNDHNIGSDYGIGEGVTFDFNKFPYLTAELGGGLQVTHHRRPVAMAADIGAMTLAKLGSGVNLIGYYMYHGGTNPKGKLTTLQETKATGYPNDLPEVSYDFRAPIREYGQISETYKEIKLLSMFLEDFGTELCKMPAYIPDENPLDPGDLASLRYSVRHDGKKGYIFFNNYVRRHNMADHSNVNNLNIELANESIHFPELDIKDKEYYFFPFNMKIGEAILKTALASPLCVLKNNTDTYVFYTDKEPMYDIEGDMGDNKIITLSREDAKNAYKVKLQKEYLIISTSAVFESDRGLRVIGKETPSIKVYPEFDKTPRGWEKIGIEGDFAIYEMKLDVASCIVTFDLTEETVDKKVYDITINLTKGDTRDCFLQINYQGDRGSLYLNDEIIADNFYTSKPWEVSLRRFGFPEKLKLEIYPLKENAEVFLEDWPTMKDGVACRLNEFVAVEEHNVLVEF
ncbi:MAG: beta-galactosidase [Anaerolineaceae bacterium]|nr:MAG: beta-galactosidase [Anaerolineaceae bacterium]